MLALDSLLVALSSLLLKLAFHRPFCMLDDSGLHLDRASRNGRVSAESVIPRTEFFDVVELEDVPNLDVAQMGHGEEVAWRQNILLADKVCHDIALGLRAYEIQS